MLSIKHRLGVDNARQPNVRTAYTTSMRTEPIPVIALTGFLGSGKTTLMNHLLENSQGLKIGVVVNDYGDINIDSQLIEGQTDATLELTNGCICCSMDSMELDEAIGQFAYSGSPIDFIVIEASGLAEPTDLAHTLREAMTPQTHLDSIVAVIDAANWRYTTDIKTAVRHQIEHSDFVVINKTDLASQPERDKLTSLITEVNDRTRIFTAVNAAIDIRLLLGHHVHDTPASHQAGDHDHSGHTHLHEQFTSVSFASRRPLDPAAFQDFINQQVPRAVYRAKGIVNLGAKGHNRKYRFQLVGKRAELTWTEWGEEVPGTELVFIGQGFDPAALQRAAMACVDPNPSTVNPARRVTLPRHHP